MNVTKEIIATAEAPPALGSYSQAVKVNGMIYVSGQLPIDPRTGHLVAGDITAQTERALLNVRAILEEGEATLADVVKVTLYLRDLNHFDEVNRIYSLFFPSGEQSHYLPPARATVEVSRLPKNAEIEIEAIAVVGSGYDSGYGDSSGGYNEIEIF